MIEWLPQVCRELHGELLKIYWMMFLPLILIFILPKMMNDPETRKVITYTCNLPIILNRNLRCDSGNGKLADA